MPSSTPLLRRFHKGLMKSSPEVEHMDAMGMHRIVEWVRANAEPFDTHDLEELDSLLAEYDIVALSPAESACLLAELRPLAEAFQSAEVAQIVAQPEELLAW